MVINTWILSNTIWSVLAVDLLDWSRLVQHVLVVNGPRLHDRETWHRLDLHPHDGVADGAVVVSHVLAGVAFACKCTVFAG